MNKPSNGSVARLTGKAGEYTVAGQLILRGARVYFPAVDDGVDLMVNEICRVQVKSGHLCATPKFVKRHGEGCYFFPLMRTHTMVDGRYTRGHSSDFCDITVLWGIDQNRFWIIPSYVVRGVQAITVGRPEPKRYVGSIDELQEMVRLGYTHEEIAKQVGVTRSRVTVMLNHPETIATEHSISHLARKYENAWEEILDFSPGPQGATGECASVEGREEMREKGE